MSISPAQYWRLVDRITALERKVAGLEGKPVPTVVVPGRTLGDAASDPFDGGDE